MGLGERGTLSTGSFTSIPPEELAKIDFSDKSSIAASVRNVNITFMVLVAVIVSMRIFTRAHMTSNFFADDVLAIFAALCIVVSASCALAATRYGLGEHVWNLTPPLAFIEETVKKCVQVRRPSRPEVSHGVDMSIG